MIRTIIKIITPSVILAILISGLFLVPTAQAAQSEEDTARQNYVEALKNYKKARMNWVDFLKTKEDIEANVVDQVEFAEAQILTLKAVDAMIAYLQYAKVTINSSVAKEIIEKDIANISLKIVDQNLTTLEEKENIIAKLQNDLPTLRTQAKDIMTIWDTPRTQVRAMIGNLLITTCQKSLTDITVILDQIEQDYQGQKDRFNKNQERLIETKLENFQQEFKLMQKDLSKTKEIFEEVVEKGQEDTNEGLVRFAEGYAQIKDIYERLQQSKLELEELITPPQGSPTNTSNFQENII